MSISKFRFLGTLFEQAPQGGGGKGGGGQSSTVQSVSYSPQEEARRQQIFEEGQRLYEQFAPTSGTYRGPVPVGFSDATLAGQGLTVGNAVGAQGMLPGVGQATNFALTGALDVQNNPFLNQAIDAAVRPAVQTFQERTIPQLRMGGVASGTLGSSRQGVAEGIAARGLNQTIADTGARMASDAYGQGLNASLSALRAVPSVMQAYSYPGSMLSQVGAQQENLAMDYENYLAQQRLTEINGPWQMLNANAALLNAMSNPTTSTSSSMPRQGISPIQAVGGIGSLLGGLGSIFGWSDIRLKRDLRHIATLPSGVPVYSYRYLWTPELHVGVVAQEVELFIPDAVSEKDGFLVVDHSKLH